MEKGTRVGFDEPKVPFQVWKDRVIEENRNGRVVRSFCEVCTKEKVSVFYIDDYQVARREMQPCRSQALDPGASESGMFMLHSIV